MTLDRSPADMADRDRPVAERVGTALGRLSEPPAALSTAVLEVFPERATARAAMLDAVPAAGRGPLHGIPFVAKGNMAVAERRNVRMGPYAGLRAESDAAAIQLLERLGAVLVGRTAFPELSLSGSEVDDNPDHPRVPNPRDTARTIGGSSSGSAAAVAAGLVPLALGTDTGGSVRIPAAFAGVPGIKPTHDLLPNGGVLPVSWSLDQVGVIGHDVGILHDTIAAVADAVAGPPPSPRVPPDRPRLGVVRDVVHAFHRTHPAVGPMLERALEILRDGGWSIHEVPGSDFIACQPVVSGIISYEAARSHGPVTAVGARPFGPAVTRRLTEGAGMSGGAYLAAMAEQGRFRARLDGVLADVDAILAPTVPFPPPLVVDLPRFDAGEHAVMTRLANLTGVPAVTVPGDRVDGAAPLGLQLMARPGEDLLALEAAARIERNGSHPAG